MTAMIELRQVSKSYGMGEAQVQSDLSVISTGSLGLDIALEGVRSSPYPAVGSGFLSAVSCEISP